MWSLLGMDQSKVPTSWEGDQSCGRRFQVEILPQHLNLTAISVVALSMESCIVRTEVTAVRFSEDAVLFFFSLQISRWMVPTMNPSHCSLLQELAARQCSRDLFTHGFRTSKNRWSEIAVHRGCSTCLEEFTTLWNIHFLLRLPYITQILPFTPTAFVLCEVGRVEEDQLCMP